MSEPDIDHDPRAVHLDLASDRLREMESVYYDEFTEDPPMWLRTTRQLVEECLEEEFGV